MAKTLENLMLKYAGGGKVGTFSAAAAKALQDAIGHLQDNDKASALSLLKSNRETASHPDIIPIIQDLSRAPAASTTKKLTQMASSEKENAILPTFADGGEVGDGSGDFASYVEGLFNGG